jgi:RimJ/RimL family protein N-acetyltransferase
MASGSPIYQVVGHIGESQFELQSKSITGLTLRIPTSETINAVIDILTNKANSELDKSISEATTEELQSIAQHWTTVDSPLTHVNFLIWLNDEPLGISGLGWIGPANKEDETVSDRAGAAGVMIQPFARGKGYAYESMRMVIDYGLRELGLVEVRVGTQSANIPMRKLMENKFGLLPEVAIDGVDKFGNDLEWTLKRDWLQPSV